MSNLKCPQTTVALNKYSKCIQLETSDDVVYYTSIRSNPVLQYFAKYWHL